MDSHARSIAKTFSWRVWATLITAMVAWIVTGELEVGITVGIFDTLIKLFAYYFHERMWTRIRFGAIDFVPPETETEDVVGKDGEGI